MFNNISRVPIYWGYGVMGLWGSDEIFLIHFPYTKMSWRTFDPSFDYVMGPGHQSEPYQTSSMKNSTAHHWGQLKLLIAEIQFLTRHSNPANGGLVVYVAAGPGEHIPDLIRMFPEYHFHLFADRFQGGLVVNIPEEIKGKYTPHVRFFGDEDAKHLRAETDKGGPVYFISDIRTGEVKEAPEAPGASRAQSAQSVPDANFEEQVLINMRQQEKWVEIIRPTAAHLKFRLPYVTAGQKTDNLNYLRGVLYVQQWGPLSTSECRLVVPRPADDEPYPKQDWNLKYHEDAMYYHNLRTRQIVNYYNIVTGDKIPLDAKLGLYSTYDPTATASIIRDYLLTRGYKNVRGSDISSLFLEFIMNINPEKRFKSIKEHADYVAKKEDERIKAEQRKNVGFAGGERVSRVMTNVPAKTRYSKPKP